MIASNAMMQTSLHGISTLGLGVLPWGERLLERREVVPPSLLGVTFDNPAIVVPTFRRFKTKSSTYLGMKSFPKSYLTKAPTKREAKRSATSAAGVRAEGRAQSKAAKAAVETQQAANEGDAADVSDQRGGGTNGVRVGALTFVPCVPLFLL